VLYQWLVLQVSLFAYLPYLALTLAIEVPLVGWLLYRRCGLLRSALAGVLASGVTHPLLWFVWPRIVSPYRYFWYVLSGESMVVLVEAAVYFLLVFLPDFGAAPAASGRPSLWRRLGKALGLSLLVNAVSFGVGMLVHLAQGRFGG
jgi:hypothetical protein